MSSKNCHEKKFPKINKAFLFILISVFYIHAKSADFNCNKKLTEIENIICKDSQLSELDSNLGNAYRFALEDSNYSERQKITEEQKLWIIHERNACNNEECFFNVYTSRIQDLASIKNTNENFHNKFSDAHYVFDSATLFKTKSDFQSTLKSSGFTPIVLKSCNRMILLDNTQKNPVFGAICSTSNDKKIMICDDTKIGKMTIKLGGFSNTGISLSEFTATNCPPGG